MPPTSPRQTWTFDPDPLPVTTPADTPPPPGALRLARVVLHAIRPFPAAYQAVREALADLFPPGTLALSTSPI